MSLIKWEAATTKLRFGIEDLLAATAQVYYESLFSTRHIGRVLDFMLFQCKDFIEGADDAAYFEYRFRQAIEQAFFAAWTSYKSGEKAKCLEVEFGWDSQKLIVSVAFQAEQGLAGFVPGTGEPSSGNARRLAAMLSQVQSLADGLIVRHEPTAGRVQVILFLAAEPADRIEGAQYADVSQLAPEPEEPESAEELVTPDPLSAADLDGFVADEDAPPPETPTETVVRGTPEEPFEEVRIGGGGPRIDENALVRGKPEAPDDTETLVKGKPEEEDKTENRFAADAPEEEVRIVIKAGPKEPTKEKVTILKSGAGPEAEPELVVKGESGAATKKEPPKPKTVMKAKLAPEKGKKDPAAQSTRREQALLEQIKGLTGQVLTLRKEKHLAQAGQQIKEGEAPESIDLSADQEERERKEIERLKSRLAEARNLTDAEKKENHQKVQEMMETVLKERAAIKHQRAEISAKLRKKEHEFKSKETGLKESLRIIEEQVKQRDSAIEKLRDNNATLSSTLDKLRAANAETTDKVELTHKLVTAEKLLEKAHLLTERTARRAEEAQKKLAEETTQRSALQVETAKQKRQIEDMQRKIAELSNESKKGVSSELLQVMDQRDKANRVIDELKRQMRELQGKLSLAAQSAKGAGGGTQPMGKASNGAVPASEAELKHKLELANNMAKAQRDELEKSKKRIEELKAQEARYRADISKLQGEVAKMQTELKAAGIKSTLAQSVAGAAAKPGAKPAAKPPGKK